MDSASKKQLHDHSQKEIEQFEPAIRKMMSPDFSDRCIVMQNTSLFLFVSNQESSERGTEKIISDICDPVSKPNHVHEYVITSSSLLRALALGYEEEQVIQFLKNNIRNRSIPEAAKKSIRRYLKEIECPSMELITQGLEPYYRFTISRREIERRKHELEPLINKYLKKEQDQSEADQFYYDVRRVQRLAHNELAEELFKLNILLKSQRKIYPAKKEERPERYLKSKKPVNVCLDLSISLKSFTQLREYQAAALNAIVTVRENHIVAKSGYIVLPCGAGKTLLSISILAKIKKETLIVCSSDSGADQFKREIEKWTQGFPRHQIIILTSSSDYTFKNCKTGQIFISTYSSLKSKLAVSKEDIRHQNQWIRYKPWGLIIFDECQTLPAEENRQIMNSLMAHVKIGLTATPMRQDDKIESLIYMIGPQLYVGNWRSFVEHGFLANPKCIQIRTKLTQTFKNKYLQIKSTSERTELCYRINPNKVKALIYLLEYHEKLSDNILVFCDDTALIRYLAARLKRPYLIGESKIEERNFIFDLFRNENIKTLFLSRIGDEAIDLPNANVAIELNILYGSRKQMLQRLGRIMRQKQASSLTSYNAMFYTIITAETEEQKHFFKRYRCLIDEGFHYDLRLFEYSDREDIEDIFKLDCEIKSKVQARMREVVGDEQKYWEMFMKIKE